MKPKKIKYKGLLVSEHRAFIMQFVEELVEQVKNKTVLDVGAGDWPWTRQLLKPVCSYIAQDVFTHPAINIVCKAEELVQTVGENSYDAVTCFDVLEHVDDPFLVAKNLYQVIRPGGFLALTVPFNYFVHAHGEKNFWDYWRFTAYGLRKMFSNFKSLEIIPNGDPLEPLGYKIIGKK